MEAFPLTVDFLLITSSLVGHRVMSCDDVTLVAMPLLLNLDTHNVPFRLPVLFSFS
jgi:hypothetical protein